MGRYWFRLDMGKRFSSERAVLQWHRLHREVVGSPSLEVFQSRVDVEIGRASCRERV